MGLSRNEPNDGLGSKTRFSRREVKISWSPILFFPFWTYFSRVPNPPNQTRGERSGTTGARDGPEP